MSLQQQLENWTKAREGDLTASYLQKWGEGKWPQSLESTVDIKPGHIKVKIDAAYYTNWMKDGRGPTSPTGPYKAGPKLWEVMLAWIERKGIQPDKGQNKKGLAYAMAQKIHKNGIQTTPDKKRLVSDAINDNDVKELINIVKSNFIQNIRIWESKV